MPIIGNGTRRRLAAFPGASVSRGAGTRQLLTTVITLLGVALLLLDASSVFTPGNPTPIAPEPSPKRIAPHGLHPRFPRVLVPIAANHSGNSSPGTPGPAVVLGGPYLVLGVATAPRNRGHRQWIRETWMSLPNVARGIDDDANLAELKALGATAVRASASPSTGVRSFFLVGVAAIAADLAEEQARERDIVGVDARETKPPGEKMFAFFQLCARAFARTARWCIKTDDDTYVHSVRLELNLRSLWDSTPSQEASPRAASPAEAPPASAGGGVADPSTGGAGGGAAGLAIPPAAPPAAPFGDAAALADLIRGFGGGTAGGGAGA
mmetsp:Transcript_22227/g.71102  ORF Transcript_22227/g.71102 Transcript_22227/m.71102 type:complete len:324 (+) Transcript_22227:42-1013(+)